MMPLTLREAAQPGKSANGETPADLGPRPGRRLPLFHGRGSRAARRYRLGQKPPRRNGRGGGGRRSRSGGRSHRLGAPRTPFGARDRGENLGDPGKLRALRDAADRRRLNRLFALARRLIALAPFLTRLRRRRLGGG